MIKFNSPIQRFVGALLVRVVLYTTVVVFWSTIVFRVHKKSAKKYSTTTLFVKGSNSRNEDQPKWTIVSMPSWDVAVISTSVVFGKVLIVDVGSCGLLSSKTISWHPIPEQAHWFGGLHPQVPATVRLELRGHSSSQSGVPSESESIKHL